MNAKSDDTQVNMPPVIANKVDNLAKLKTCLSPSRYTEAISDNTNKYPRMAKLNLESVFNVESSIDKMIIVNQEKVVKVSHIKARAVFNMFRYLLGLTVLPSISGIPVLAIEYTKSTIFCIGVKIAPNKASPSLI